MKKFEVMGLLNKKMLLAPILAVTLALLMAGAVGFLPQTIVQNQSTPQPSSTSTTQAMAASTNGSIAVLLFGVAALVVGVVAAFLFFSEKKLNKEIHG